MAEQAERASENAALLRVLDTFPPKRRYADLAEYCARTIRGLEDEIAKLKHGLQRVQSDKERLICDKRNLGNRHLRNLLSKRTHAVYRVIDDLRARRAEVAHLTSELAAARSLVQAILTAVPFSHVNASLEYRAREFIDAARRAGEGEK